MKQLFVMLVVAGCGFEGSNPLAIDAAPGGSDGRKVDAAPIDMPAPNCAGFIVLDDGGNPGSTYAGIGNAKWRDAETACEGYGAHLVILDNDPELQAVANFAGNELWVGLSDLETPRVWRDVTGAVSAFALPSGGPPWAAGEPSAGSKDHVVTLKARALDAKSPDETHLTMCECDHKPVDPTAFP